MVHVQSLFLWLRITGEILLHELSLEGMKEIIGIHSHKIIWVFIGLEMVDEEDCWGIGSFNKVFAVHV